MSPALTIIWLGWACYIGAAIAIVVYVVHFAGRQGWKRPWNAAGLFFTSIALSKTPSLFRYVDNRGVSAAAIVTLCLLAACAVQAFTALRRRRQEDRILNPDASMRDRRA